MVNGVPQSNFHIRPNIVNMLFIPPTRPTFSPLPQKKNLCNKFWLEIKNYCCHM